VPIFPENSRGCICTKSGKASRLANLITWDIFFPIGVGCLDSASGRILPFFYARPVDVNTVLALPRSLWCLYLSPRFTDHLHASPPMHVLLLAYRQNASANASTIAAPSCP